MCAVRCSLPVWIAIAAIVAVSGFVIALSTDDNEPRYDQSFLSTVTCAAFLAASLLLIVRCLVAGVLAGHRGRMDGRERSPAHLDQHLG